MITLISFKKKGKKLQFCNSKRGGSIQRVEQELHKFSILTHKVLELSHVAQEGSG